MEMWLGGHPYQYRMLPKGRSDAAIRRRLSREAGRASLTTLIPNLRAFLPDARPGLADDEVGVRALARRVFLYST